MLVSHVNDTKGIYLHGNCHVNLSCDLVLTWECHVKEPENQGFPFLTWEFHVEVPVNQGLRLPDMGIPCKWTLETRKTPPLTADMGIPCTQGPESAHLHGILCQYCNILQQAFPTWNSYVDLVTFRNLRGSSMWEAVFLWPLIWVSHVKTIKNIQEAQNMRNPCETVTNSQQHGIPMFLTRWWAHQHTISM